MLRPLLIPLTYFCLQTCLGISQAQCQVELNMTENAFDDQYLGCAEEIAHAQIKSEMSQFSPLWERATEKWNSVKTTISRPDGFKDEYGIAIVAYTDHRPYNGKTFPTEFNDAVRENAYSGKFQFKTFHYYLTRALQLLRDGCHNVYRGDPNCFEYHGGDIRFGRFASSSLSKEVAESFRKGGTLFTIHTCFGVNIQALSYSPDQKEVLIPVHETFSVSPKEKNHFVLGTKKQTCSYFNCGKKNNVCVGNSATRGGLAFPGELSPSLFGGSVILVHVAALKLFPGF